MYRFVPWSDSAAVFIEEFINVMLRILAVIVEENNCCISWVENFTRWVLNRLKVDIIFDVVLVDTMLSDWFT